MIFYSDFLTFTVCFILKYIHIKKKYLHVYNTEQCTMYIYMICIPSIIYIININIRISRWKAEKCRPVLDQFIYLKRKVKHNFLLKLHYRHHSTNLATKAIRIIDLILQICQPKQSALSTSFYKFDNKSNPHYRHYVTFLSQQLKASNSNLSRYSDFEVAFHFKNLNIWQSEKKCEK